MGHQQDEWLMDEDNLEKWTGKMCASERRVLMTHWLGEAAREVNDPANESTLRKYFEHTGCLLAADRSEDGGVKLDGLVGTPDYLQGDKLPPFSVLDVVVTEAPGELREEPADEQDSWDNGLDQAEESGVKNGGGGETTTTHTPCFPAADEDPKVLEFDAQQDEDATLNMVVAEE
jgi:hypothetical protein